MGACGLGLPGGVTECWGNTPMGTQTEPSSAGVSVGEVYGCLLSACGAVACWGSNTGGRSTPPADFS
ncbi:MAG: hypothetical protein ACREJ3_03250 [Polyangiaceae bacterium]